MPPAMASISEETKKRNSGAEEGVSRKKRMKSLAKKPKRDDPEIDEDIIEEAFNYDAKLEKAMFYPLKEQVKPVFYKERFKQCLLPEPSDDDDDDPIPHPLKNLKTTCNGEHGEDRYPKDNSNLMMDTTKQSECPEVMNINATSYTPVAQVSTTVTEKEEELKRIPEEFEVSIMDKTLEEIVKNVFSSTREENRLEEESISMEDSTREKCVEKTIVDLCSEEEDNEVICWEIEPLKSPETFNMMDSGGKKVQEEGESDATPDREEDKNEEETVEESSEQSNIPEMSEEIKRHMEVIVKSETEKILTEVNERLDIHVARCYEVIESGMKDEMELIKLRMEIMVKSMATNLTLALDPVLAEVRSLKAGMDLRFDKHSEDFEDLKKSCRSTEDQLQVIHRRLGTSRSMTAGVIAGSSSPSSKKTHFDPSKTLSPSDKTKDS